ncbi:MAG TPA: NADH-quinone oxidoreductase subunit C [Anaerolineales bacterium]|nr:NADH-quinone oxidoreductase subunit C [Anaerolineales bacterium]HRF47208.1 NADH-quinone oxidoreductase subunit C [Anaerolineales bacterium]
MTTLEQTLTALKAKFGDAIEAVETFRGETTVVVTADKVVDVLKHLRETPALNFRWLADVTAYDDYPEEPRFKVCYQIRNLMEPLNLRIKTAVGGETPTLASCTSVYPAAGWQERELFDMFGITFTGHPDLRRILMPSDWEGHPLRKDYPLGYEEVQFTFNYDAIDKKKPYAKE